MYIGRRKKWFYRIGLGLGFSLLFLLWRGFPVFSEDPVPAAPQEAEAAEATVEGRYLILHLDSRREGGPFSLGRAPGPSELNYIQAIERAKRDKRIRGILLNAAGFSGSPAALWDLRSALEGFKASGKKVAAFFDDGDFDLYCLLSAADAVIMDDMGVLLLTGYHHERLFFQHTLEKLGVGLRELRYFDYKSALDTFTRDSLSDADRLQYGAYLDDIFKTAKEAIMQGRSLDDERFSRMVNREFMYSPQEALKQGLVDAVGREEAVAQALAELEGGPVKEFASFGGSGSVRLIPDGFTVRSYHTGGSRNIFGLLPEIAVINALGHTDLEEGMKARRLVQIIRAVSQKSRVKALVIRIDSPGGSALAADYIAQAVREAQGRVPVVVSMGSAAASGGYWAAMYADHIFASPYTITGSIGVIGSWFYNTRLYDTLGLSMDTLRRGDHADLFTGFIVARRDLSQEEEERYRRYILELYAVFVQKAAEGRNMPVEAMKALAQGRIYSGTRARDAGLVDRIGGLGDALAYARNLAGIPEDQRAIYREYPKPSLLETLMARLFARARGGAAAGRAGPGEFIQGLLSGGGGSAFWQDIQYRIFRNGQVMPILPLQMTGNR
ncbi:MAG: signal peptide peptidase SppA [Treponema sp.]|jgi:protease-4|nr:signal peptide peptidase SppA [Treponema sp.]